MSFENKLKELASVEFMGTVTHLFGVKFVWKRNEDGILDVHMDQTAFLRTSYM